MPRGPSMGGRRQRAFRGLTDEWLTPPEILAALGPFDLDPCAADPRPWDTAARHYTGADDGLSMPWGAARVWMNPPYGPEMGRWLRRLARHGDGIALVFARTETSAFHRSVWPVASGILFLRGRLRFHRPDGTRAETNAAASSVLIAYGAANAGCLSSCGLPGAFVPLGRPRAETSSFPPMSEHRGRDRA